MARDPTPMTGERERNHGWPFNMNAFGFCYNIGLATALCYAGIYWVLPLPIGFAVAACVSQICAALSLPAQAGSEGTPLTMPTSTQNI